MCRSLAWICAILEGMSHIKFCSVVLILAGCLLGQTPPTVTGNYRSSLELLPNAATNMTDPHNVAVVRTSGTVLTIGNGASTTAPQTVRSVGPGADNFYTRQFTSAVTLTSASGGITGTIYIFALPIAAPGATETSLQVVVISNLGGVLNCTGAYTCTVVTRSSQLATQARAAGAYLAAATMTAGSPAQFDVSGVRVQTQGLNAWVRGILVNNFSASAVSVAVVDGRGVSLGNWSIPAGTTQTLSLAPPGYEVFLERGMIMTAGTPNAVNIMVLRVLPNLTYSPAVPQ